MVLGTAASVWLKSSNHGGRQPRQRVPVLNRKDLRAFLWHLSCWECRCAPSGGTFEDRIFFDFSAEGPVQDDYQLRCALGSFRMEETTRVLIVDDFQPFRAWVLSLFRERPTLIAVGEASDGAQAIEKAKELRPDLILLDIGLPKLHGIEVARRVREFSPSSRILFLSQETSREVIEEAMATGAGGYVCKSKSGGELLP